MNKFLLRQGYELATEELGTIILYFKYINININYIYLYLIIFIYLIQIDALFRVVDYNEDGKISYKEYYDAVVP